MPEKVRNPSQRGPTLGIKISFFSPAKIKKDIDGEEKFLAPKGRVNGKSKLDAPKGRTH
jgi:hypothetical protein